MKAAVHFAYGNPDLVRVADLPRPECPPDGYVVRVKSCSANPADWKYIHGNWKWVTGNKFPRQIGADFAGVIDAAGGNTRSYKPGDEVMGSVNPFKTGTAAEYVAVHEGQFCAKPPGLDYGEAAGIPIAGGTAYIGLIGSRMELSGKSVLVTGAGGGVGHLSVQLAHHLGARVTGVCSAEKGDFVTELGADDVVDYRTSDIARLGRSFDLILDCAAALDYPRARQLLNPGGQFILLELNGKIWLFAAAALSRAIRKKYMRTYLASPSAARCKHLKELFDGGVLRMTIGGRFPLARAGEALSLLKDGHAKGKIIIDIE